MTQEDRRTGGTAHEGARSWILAALVVGMALSGAVAIWFVPSLTDPQVSSRWEIVGPASATVGILAVVARSLRPARRGPPDPPPDRHEPRL